MSYWARTVDPSFSAPEPNFEPIRAELVAGPPPDSPTRGRCTSVAVRGCRCVGVLLLVLILWLIGTHFWMVHSKKAAEGEEQLSTVQEVSAVEVTVYYEAFCPDSRSFIVGQLWPTYQKMPETLHVELVPYGKAKTVQPASSSGGAASFSCQHGSAECRANLVHACGLRLADGSRQGLQFVVCLLQQMRPALFRRHAAKCASSSNLSWPAIDSCSTGGAISEVMARYGERTEALRPRLTFVPTVTVNGSQDRQEEMRSYFLNFVCNSYKGLNGQKLAGCP